MTRCPLRVACCFALLALLASGGAIAATPSNDNEDWVALFNGRDLTGWTPKVAGHALGENFANTFRVEDGMLKVRYDDYPKFDGEFAHLFYERPYSHYRLVIEYRLVGEQKPGGPSWASHNSGVMLHAQSPQTMTRDQDFPISVEAQFLRGFGDGKPRPTMNMCSPGTEVVYKGTLYPGHCLESTSKTYHGEDWVRVEVHVLGDATITHFVEGERVLEYAMPQIGGGVVNKFDPAAKPDGKLLDSGYIALQAESHGIDFRKVELLDLTGCMDKTATNYRRYYVKSMPERCEHAANARATKLP